MTQGMEVNTVGLGLAEIGGPKFNVTLVLRQVAARRISDEYGEEVVTWVPRKLATRAGMAQVIYHLQLNWRHRKDEYGVWHPEFSEEEIWDQWFDDPNIIGDAEITAHMIKAFGVCTASKEVLAELEAAYAENQAAAQKKLAEQSPS